LKRIALPWDWVKSLALRGARCEALLVAIGLGVPLSLGIIASADYGLGWDESIQHRLARQAWRYVFQDGSGYLRSADRVYGPAFELLLLAAEKALRIEDIRDVYLLRHLLTFLTFWSAALAFHALARRSFRSWRLGLLASTLLFLSPRIVADAFYNSKDLPFLSFFVIAVWTLFRFLDKPTLARALVHALACAFATDIRIMGVLLVPLSVLGALASGRGGGPVSSLPGPRALLTAAVMAAGYLAGVVLLWPFLWRQPLQRFAEAFAVMAHFPWRDPVLFMGQRSPATELPWLYLPVWIGITTPLSVLLFLPLGMARGLRRFRHRGEGCAEAAVTLAWALLPVAGVIALRSVLYDGWRQMYFVYPALVMLAVAGIRLAWHLARDIRAKSWKRATAAAGIVLFLADMADTTCWMIRWHPYQNVYFNRLAGSRASLSQRFEVDYWGVSARRLLEYVVTSDSRSEITVFAVEPSVEGSAQMLLRDNRRRLRFVSDPADADYIVTHHRYGTAAAAAADEVFSVRVDGMRIGSVMRGCRAATAATWPSRSGSTDP